MLLVGGFLLLAGISTVAIWIGSGRFEGAADRLSRHYGVPPIVQGAVIVAIGSSLPELLTAVLAPLVHADIELGIAAIVGSAVFNILVIPALATFAAGGTLRGSRKLVYREAYFYIVAVIVFSITLVLAAWPSLHEGTGMAGTLTPALSLLPLSLYGVYLAIQYRAFRAFSDERRAVSITPWKQWATLGLGFILILGGVEGLIRAAIALSGLTDTPSFIWGLTLIAVATSVPDTFVSIRAAGNNRSVASMANVFGSNTFDLLVAVPAGVIAVGGTTVAVGALSPILLFLLVATGLLFIVLRSDFEIHRPEAYVLLFVYVLFLVGIVIFERGIG